MFGLIRRLRKRRRNRNREIFRFWDGDQERGIDPLVVVRALYVHPTFRADVHPTQAMAGDPEAMRITLEAMRDVFSIVPFREDGAGQTGLTDQETLELYTLFGEWLDSVKKNISATPTTPPATQPPVSTEDATTAPRTTSVSSDST